MGWLKKLVTVKHIDMAVLMIAAVSIKYLVIGLDFGPVSSMLYVLPVSSLLYGTSTHR